ncbi:hypothetical protein Tco_0736577 [Tanacetum coccineum]
MSYRSASMGSGEKMQSGVDMPLLRTITNIVGQSMWFKAIVALNHVSFAPLEDPKDHEKVEFVILTIYPAYIWAAVTQASDFGSKHNTMAYLLLHEVGELNGDSGPLLLQAVQGFLKSECQHVRKGHGFPIWRYVNSRGSGSSISGDIGVWSSLIGTQISSTKLRRPEHRESWCQTFGAKLQKWCHVSKMEFGTRNAMAPEFSGSGLAPEFLVP